MSRNSVLAEVWNERESQEAKWGEQNHADRNEDSAHDVEYYEQQATTWKLVNEARVADLNAQGMPSDRNCYWDGVLLEEVYEALAEEDPATLRAELIQVAAVAVAWVEAIDRRADR